MKKYILSIVFLAFATIAFAQMPKATLEGNQLEITFSGQDQVEYVVNQKDFASDQMVQISKGSIPQNATERSFQFPIEPNGVFLLKYKVMTAGNDSDLWMEVDPLSLVGKDHE